MYNMYILKKKKKKCTFYFGNRNVLNRMLCFKYLSGLKVTENNKLKKEI